MKRILCLFVFILTCAAPIYSQKAVPLDARLRGGKIHFQGGRYARALEQFDAALVDFPGNPEARFWKAIVLEKTGKFIESAVNFDSTFITAPEWLDKTQKDEMFQYSAWNAFIKAGQKMDENGDYASAISYYKRATNINPQSPQAFLYLSQVYTTLDSLEEIKNIAKSLFELDPQNQQVNILLGLYFFRKEDWDSSMVYYNKAAEFFMQDRQNAVANIAKELKQDLDQAEITANKLIVKRNTRSLETFINDSLKAKNKLVTLGRLTEQLYLDHAELNICNFRSGVAALQKANDIKPESLQQRYFKTAIDYFIEASKYNPVDYDAKFNLGMTYYRSGADIKAESIFNTLTQLILTPLQNVNPKLSQNILSLITMENLSAGLFEIVPPVLNEIDKEFEKAYTFKTGYWYLYYTDFKKAKELPTSANYDKIFLSTFNSDIIENLWLLLGATQTNLKKFDDAIKAFNMVLDLNPKNQDAYRNLAVCYREKGDQVKAYEILQQGEKMKKQ